MRRRRGMALRARRGPFGRSFGRSFRRPFGRSCHGPFRRSCRRCRTILRPWCGPFRRGGFRRLRSGPSRFRARFHPLLYRWSCGRLWTDFGGMGRSAGHGPRFHGTSLARPSLRRSRSFRPLRYWPILRNRWARRRRLPILGRQRFRRHQGRRPTMVNRRELLTVPRRLPLVLDLRSHRRNGTFPPHRLFSRCRPRVDSPSAAVVADTVHRDVVDRVVVNVVNDVDVDTCHVAVISEDGMFPISPLVAAPAVSETVVDAAVKPDMRTPISMMPPVAGALISPIRRRPQRADERGKHPRSGNPVVSALSIAPNPGCPDVVIAWAFRLRVFG